MQACIVATIAVDDTVEITVVVKVVTASVRKLLNNGKTEFGIKLKPCPKNFVWGFFPILSALLNGTLAWVPRTESIPSSSKRLRLGC